MDLVLEEEFLELMVMLFRNLPMSDIWQTDTRHRQAEYSDQETEILTDLQVDHPPSPFHTPRPPPPPPSPFLPHPSHFPSPWSDPIA